jgi:multidrug efflux system outer membrane protein
LMQQCLRSGVVQPDEVEQYVQRIEATGGNLADLTADMAATLGRLTLLTGQEPGALDARLTRAGATLPTVPARVAVGDPAALLQRRPDIRAAERRLAGRSAQIGQQKANYFPKLRLLGDIGFSGTDAAQVLRADSLSLIAVPYLSWNVLDFGRTAAAVRQAEANRDEALANYQETVLAALQDANTALARFGQQRQSVQHLLAQQASSQRLLDVTVQRRQAGVATQIDVLDAQRRHADAQLNVLNGETQLLKHYVALQKSLGLGWRLPG